MRAVPHRPAPPDSAPYAAAEAVFADAKAYLYLAGGSADD